MTPYDVFRLQWVNSKHLGSKTSQSAFWLYALLGYTFLGVVCGHHFFDKYRYLLSHNYTKPLSCWYYAGAMLNTMVDTLAIHPRYPYNIMDVLQWRHNGCDAVSNHQPHNYLLNRLFRRRSTKKKLRFTGLCAGNSPMTGEFPAQRASYAENVSIWWRHHVLAQLTFTDM